MRTYYRKTFLLQFYYQVSKLSLQNTFWPFLLTINIFSTQEALATKHCNNLTISPSTLPDGYRGRPYEVNLSGLGGVAPYYFKVIDQKGNFKIKDNKLYATLDTPKVYQFQVILTDAAGCRLLKDFRVNVQCNPLVISPAQSTLLATTFTEYEQEISIGHSDGTYPTPIRLSIDSGSFPQEFDFDMEFPYWKATISGNTATTGRYVFRVKAEDDFGCVARRTYTLDIIQNPDICVSPASIPNFPLGAPIKIKITTCRERVWYSVNSNNLPSFLRLETEYDEDYNDVYYLVGTATTPGHFEFAVTVSLYREWSTTKTYSFDVIPPAKIRYQVWKNIEWPDGKPTIPDLESLITRGVTPDRKDNLTYANAPSNIAENFGSRVSGTLVAPQSGYYTFHISSSHQSKLTIKNRTWVRVLATVPDYTLPLEWTKYPSQHSDPIWLAAGTHYQLEALHVGAIGDDHVAIGWRTPFAPEAVKVISGNYFKLVKEPEEIPAPPISELSKKEATAQLSLTAIPNDFNKDVRIQFSNAAEGIIELQLIDIQGNIIKEIFKGATAKSQLKEINVPQLNLKKGVYLLKLSNGKKTIYKKVIKTE